MQNIYNEILFVFTCKKVCFAHIFCDMLIDNGARVWYNNQKYVDRDSRFSWIFRESAVAVSRCALRNNTHPGVADRKASGKRRQVDSDAPLPLKRDSAVGQNMSGCKQHQ